MKATLTKREAWNRRREIIKAVFTVLMIICLGPWIIYTLSVVNGGLLSMFS